MRKTFPVLLAAAGLLFTLVPTLPAGEVMEIPGTGNCQQVLTILAEEFNKGGKKVQVIIPETVGSVGGLRQVIDGKATVARTSRPLRPEEKAKGLTEHLFALTPIAFVVHPSVTGIKGLTREEVAGIFAGRYRNWKDLGGPDAPIYPVDREAEDACRSIIEREIPPFAQAASVGKIFYTTPETAAALAEHRFTFGFLPMQMALEKGLTVLALDGVYPTADQVRGGRYPLRLPFYLVTRGEPAEDVQAFLDYLHSPPGERKLRALNVMPATEP